MTSVSSGTTQRARDPRTSEIKYSYVGKKALKSCLPVIDLDII